MDLKNMPQATFAEYMEMEGLPPSTSKENVSLWYPPFCFVFVFDCLPHTYVRDCVSMFLTCC